MTETGVYMLVFLYIIPVIISYLFIRQLLKEGEEKAGVSNLVFTFTPVVNFVLAIAAIMSFLAAKFTDENFIRRFFMLPPVKDGKSKK